MSSPSNPKRVVRLQFAAMFLVAAGFLVLGALSVKFIKTK